MELLEHAQVANHVIRVLIELKFKVVLLTFHRLRHEDFLLEGFGMKNTLKTLGTKTLINAFVNVTGDCWLFPNISETSYPLYT